MLNDLEQLEQRARHLYAPTMTSQTNGRTVHQCELVIDELAEQRARMRARLAPLAVAVFYFVADLCLLPRIVARWLKQWKRTAQVG
jgi:hypothetical protein